MGWLRLLVVMTGLAAIALTLYALLTGERRYMRLARRLALTGLLVFVAFGLYYALARLIQFH